jgi:hypothetical protein
MKKLTCLMMLLLAQSSSGADFNSDAKGTTTASFLKLGVGARAVGMGEAYSAVADDATALYWNPAALSRIDSSDATFMHAPYLASTFYDYGAFAHRMGNHAFGVGVQYFSAGSIDQTDINNTALGSFNPYDLAASLGYAYRFGEDGPAVGLAGKFIQSKILNTANAFAVDLGVLSREYAERWRFAFTTVNLGSKMKFEQESEDLPLALRLGSSLKLTEHWLASLDVVAPKDNSPYVATGTEYAWHLTDAMALAGRLGYNSLTQGDISGMTGFAFGVGFGFQRFSLDYAFLPYGGVGITHRISLSFKWGSSDTSRPVLSQSAPEHPAARATPQDDLDNLLKK